MVAEKTKNGQTQAVAPVEPRRLGLFEQMEREFEAMRRQVAEAFRLPAFTPARRLLTEAETAWAPTSDAYVADGTLVVEAELPGVKKEDITINVSDGFLNIEGRRAAEKEVKEAKYYASERFAGTFSRSFALPDGVDADKITAEYKDGVLKVTVPLPTAATAPTKIAIKS